MFKIQQLTYLNSKALKFVRKALDEQYGLDEKLDYVFFISQKNDLYVINRDYVEFSDGEIRDKLRINSIGIYFGEFKKDEVRLSIEGSQIVGPLAKKNVFKINSKLAKMWMYGLDIPCDADVSGYVIIYDEETGDYLGCGRYKENKILNHVPKGRRIHE